MFISKTTLRVRYAETDQLGIVYYGNYAQYYEVGRVEALRQLGFSYKKLEEAGIAMPVLSLNCKFIRPALYDDLLTIQTTISQLPGTRMHFEYELFNEEGVLINKGDTVLAFLSGEEKRPIKAPEWLLDIFRKGMTGL